MAIGNRTGDLEHISGFSEIWERGFEWKGYGTSDGGCGVMMYT